MGKRGRPPQPGGSVEKRDYIQKEFINKGKSRAEAIAGVMKVYPNTNKHYAQTLLPLKKIFPKSTPTLSERLDQKIHSGKTRITVKGDEFFKGITDKEDWDFSK